MDLHLNEISNIDLKKSKNERHSGILKSKQPNHSRFKSLTVSGPGSINCQRTSKNRDLGSDGLMEDEGGSMAIADISDN